MDDHARLALLAVLRPWLDALGGAMAVHSTGLPDFEDVTSDDVVWLSAKSPAGHIPTQAFEALELLALAQRADFSLWRAALLAATAHSERMTIPERGRACPVGCVVYFSNRDDAMTISARCRPRPDADSVSDAFWVIRHRLIQQCVLQAASRGSAVVETPDRPVVPVQVRLFYRGFEQQLQHVIHIASIQSGCGLSDVFDPFISSNWKPFFRVTAITTPFSPRLTPIALRYLTQISSSSIAIDRVSVKDLDMTDSMADTVIRGLQTLLRTGSCGAAEMPGPVGSINIPVRLAPNVVEAVFSALHAALSVNLLAVSNNVQPDPDRGLIVGRAERDYFWRWAAFALFGPYRSRCIRDIVIYEDCLSAEDVEAFCQQINNPRTVPVYSHSNGVVSVPIVGSVDASRFHLRPPGLHKASESATEFIESTPRRVLALSSGASHGEFQEVLLPGYGLAWVPRCTIERNRQPSGQLLQSTQSFSMCNLEDTGKYSLLRLFQAVGAHFTIIKLLGINTVEPLDGWLSEIFRACPLLKELHLTNGGQIDSLMLFSEVFDRDECQLSQLKLTGVRVNDKESVVEFISAIGNDSSSIANKLQVFTYEEEFVRVPMPRLLPAIEAMLECNRVLLQLDIGISFAHHVQSVDQTHISRITRAHDGALIPICRRPIDRNAKTAFLSVLSRTRTFGSPDTNVLMLIFAFAGECTRRHVAVNCSVEEP